MPEFHSTHHRPTAREQARARRVRREKAANAREAAFGRIHWDSYDHRELWDMVQSAEPPKLGEQAHRWAELAKGVDTATGDVHALVQKLLLSWRGPSAAGAAGSVRKLTTWASTASENARQIGDGLDTYTAAIGEARRKMPEPVHYWAERWFREGYAVKRLDGPEGTYLLDDLLDDQLPTRQQAADAKAEAVRVMEQYESASHDVRHRLPPVFDTAPAVSAADPGVAVTPSGPGSDPGGGPGSDPGSGPGLDPPFVDRAPGDSTSTASVVPGTALSGAGTVTGAGLPVGLDGVIGTAGGTGLSGSGWGGVPAPGVPGALGEGARAGSGRFGAPGPVSGPGGTGGGRGPAGGYGMYPPGQGAQREEDTEHHDKYASGYDLMDDLPPAYPPVFGE
ncbi:WXG100 family type VII secretion target [Amycolatopsis sp. CA-128772]|uniref:WXG100 family type VII secretion target n=1 Tax=Amycolatopsis sp. CA-128772 TaxID=2073159 RepID=UPI0011B0531E|nr:PPE domain-containing protein [Amycolatopsis sp. CA-128772]